MFSCKVATNSFIGPNKGSYPDADAAVLHLVKESLAKGTHVTQAMQVRQQKPLNQLGIHFKAGRGRCDRFIGCEGIEHPAVRILQPIFKRNC
jgi:hypothetical protein